jgi:transposase
MTPKTDREKYALILQAIQIAPKGALLQTAAELLDVAGENTVRTILRRLEARGYDLSAWFAATGRPRGKAQDRDEQRYNLLMQAAHKARPGQLIRMATALTGLSEAGVRGVRERLEARGYDFGDWDVAAAQGMAVGRSKQHPRPAPPMRRNTASGNTASGNTASAPAPAPTKPAYAPAHVLTRRAQWFADVREVSGKPGAIRLLCDKWNCEPPTAKGRIHSLKGLGYDLSWWDAHGGKADKAAEVPLRAVRVEPLPLPVVAASKPGKAPPWKPELPYTMQGIADIVGMPVMAVRFTARAHGIGFDQWCLAPDVAVALLAALGFTRRAAA